jgi:G3E family GTPase
MRVHVICGFLGSGKTTLLQRILAERATGESLAVIVNEFGQVGVDGTILAGERVDMIEMTSGCLCCTLKGPLVEALDELRRTKGVVRVVIEATGVAQPAELEEVLRDPVLAGSVSTAPLVTVVDVAKFGALRRVLGSFYTAQVSHADVLLLNKIDLVTAEELERVRRDVGALNRRATVIPTERCKAELAMVLEGRRERPGPSALEQGLASPAPAASFVSFVVPAGFDAERAKVEGFFASLPADIVRAKGFMRVDGELSTVQFAGGRLEVTRARNPRELSLVFISRTEPDRAAIAEALGRTGRA